MTILPQVQKSAAVPNEKKARALEDQDVLDAMNRMQQQLAGKGRVLVRASGTEPIVRIMLEGEDIEIISQMADQLTELIVSRYGA
jgi:phosphoglucosamine mutase